MNRYKHKDTGEIKSHKQWQNEIGMSFHAERLPEFLRIPERPAADRASLSALET